MARWTAKWFGIAFPIGILVSLVVTPGFLSLKVTLHVEGMGALALALFLLDMEFVETFGDLPARHGPLNSTVRAGT